MPSPVRCLPDVDGRRQEAHEVGLRGEGAAQVVDLAPAGEPLAVVGDFERLAVKGDLDLGGARVDGVHHQFEDRFGQCSSLALDHRKQKFGMHAELAVFLVRRAAHACLSGSWV